MASCSISLVGLALNSINSLGPSSTNTCRKGRIITQVGNISGIARRKQTTSYRKGILPRAAAPDEEKMTRRSPLEFPVEWEKPRPGRRPDIFPQFSPMKPPLPRPLPKDPPLEEEEEEEKEANPEEEPEEPEEEPDQPSE